MRTSAADLRNQVSLKAYAEEVLDHTAQGALVCPCCASGTGPHHTPAFSIQDGRDGEKAGGIRWKCFSCGEGGDIFDLAKAVGGFSSFNDAYNEVWRWYKGDGDPTHAEAKTRAVVEREPTEEELAAQKDIRAKNVRYIHGCQSTIERVPQGFEYMRARGFTDDETRSFGIGYNSRKDRIVIPWSLEKDESYHIDRCISDESQGKYIVPSTVKTGQKKTPYHVEQALEHDIIWAVEGLFDAMSVDVAGGHALALCGTAWRGAAAELTSRDYDGIVIVSLDRDAPGQRAGREMYQALRRDGIHTVLHTSPLPGGVKDMNEALAADRGALTAYIQKVECAAVVAVMEDERRKMLEQSVDIEQDAMAPEPEPGRMPDAIG